MEIKVPNILPQYLYKFYSFNEFGRPAFLEHYLYLSHPCQLNDFIDGVNYTLDLREVANDSREFDRLKQEVLNSTPDIKNLMDFEKGVTFKNKEGVYKLQEAINRSYFDFGGIASLASHSRFNELMWSHYAKETGFVIEFYTDSLLQDIRKHILNYPFRYLRLAPVIYRNHPISVDCKWRSIHEINVFNAYQKQKDWSYENEWRILATTNELIGRTKELEKCSLKGYLYYHTNAISRIYLGRKFWNNISYFMKEKKENEEVYVVKNEYMTFVKELTNYISRIFMSGTGECCEYKFGTNRPVYNVKSNQFEYFPKSYYLTRSFERIKNIKIENSEVTVIYEGKYRTKDEDFDDPLFDIESDLNYII